MPVANRLAVERAGSNARTLLRIVAGLMALFILIVAAFLVYTRVAG